MSFAGTVELERMKTKPQIPDVLNFPRMTTENSHLYPAREQVKTVSETKATSDERNKTCLRTAEMRLVAARKMEEAAKAAELLAIAEMEAISNCENDDFPGFMLPEHLRLPPTPKRCVNLFSETSIFRHSVLEKMEEATVEVKQSKLVLEEALNRVDLAHRKQLAAEDALRRWIPGKEQNTRGAKSSLKPDNHTEIPFFSRLKNLGPVEDVPKPVLKPNVSMRDVLRQKDFVTPTKNGNLGEMLNELKVKEEVKYHPVKGEKDGNEEKQFVAQRRRFGFIHISLPLSKQSKKKTRAFNN